MILVLLAIAFGLATPVAYRRWQAGRRRRLLTRQLRESLQGLAHALQVGVGFLPALDYLSREIQKPLSTEWKAVLQAVRIGKPMNEAIGDLVKRVPLPEMQWFVAAVQITQSTGGSLATVLDTLANTLQEQETLREKISALTAQGKASGLVLGCVPFAVMGAMTIMAPDLMRPMFTTWLGQLAISAVVISVTCGGLVIYKIVSIKVDA